MSFQLTGVPYGSTIAVAMSGGVDSSVAAAILSTSGYKVIGITLQLYKSDDKLISSRIIKGSCCSIRDSNDAKRVADKLGFTHYTLNYEDLFYQEVIKNFVEGYANGKTPIPCVRCNQKIKFGELLEISKSFGAKVLVTGHYVSRYENSNYEIELHQSRDLSKDQSYFLFTITKDQLNYLRFPLSNLTKEETRKLALDYGLDVFNKEDSQDICFVSPNERYTEIIKKIDPHNAFKVGDIVNINNQVLGKHKGIVNYTIGQRKGINIISIDGQPLYVIQIDAENNKIVVGSKELLARNRIIVKDLNWFINLNDLESIKDVKVKIRSSHTPCFASLKIVSDNQIEVILNEPEYGIAIGQACVFYKGTRVLGGGWIEQSF